MRLEAFEEFNFQEESLTRIEQANEIIDELQAQGFTLTLRQLFYQHVARGLIPNTERSYKNLGSLISKARLTGMVSWDAIEDRTRNLQALLTWSDPGEIVHAVARQFRVDIWEGQIVRPEVWIEKEALVGVIAPVCHELRVDFFACRGYVSQSEQWAAGRRIRKRLEEDRQMTTILHLGDHDPSGIDMTRDNRERLTLFSGLRDLERDVPLVRLALNMDQVEEMNPPPNPTKVNDSRAPDYIRRFGRESWELDALPPQMIVALIRGAIGDLIQNPRLMQERREQEEHGRERLREIAEEL